MISKILEMINGRGYKAYKKLEGREEKVRNVTIRIIKVQGDPFAPPSIIMAETEAPREDYIRKYPIPVSDYALRIAYRYARNYSLRGLGEGKSGNIMLPRPGPIMIRRSASEIILRRGVPVLRLRLWVGLPSRKRRVMSDIARELLLERIPDLVQQVIKALLSDKIKVFVDTWIEQEYIRSLLPKRRLVSFIADGSILPRACGGCDEPLKHAVPFESPPSMRVEFNLPTGRTVSGMGIREGITLVAGPAFHGKTTLIEAIAHGIWNHIPGDGRELVITRRDAFWVQSENGRWVSCVDVSPWVESIPGLRDPKCWTTSDASGATSAVASIQEAIEAGSKVILIDEDWTATNFIHRDPWTEEVTGKRTLLTISDLAPALRSAGISVIVVASGSLQLLANADQVIVMDEYKPRDATVYAFKSRKIVSQVTSMESHIEYIMPKRRKLAKAFALLKPRLRGRLLESKSLEAAVDLSGLKQLEEEGQFNAVIQFAKILVGSSGNLVERAKRLESSIVESGWVVLGGRVSPGLSEVRWLDILYLVNRLPGISVVSD